MELKVSRCIGIHLASAKRFLLLTSTQYRHLCYNIIMREGRRSYILKYILFAIIASIFFAMSLSRAEASSNRLVINEVYPNQLSDGIDTEWAELFNPTESELDLSEYTLIKITSTGTEYKKQLSSSLCSNTGAYYVCNLGINWLANSGATLELRKGSDEIDRVVFGALASNAPIPDQGESISRIPNGQDTDSDKSDFQVVPITKGSENYPVSPPSPIIYSDKIIINEVFPEPATRSDDEYIEILNTGTEEVDLSGWRLDDATAGSEYEIPAGTKIAGGEYLVLCKDSANLFCDFNYKNISLNDTSADSAILLDPDGDIKNSISYPKAERGKSYSLINSIPLWTLELTPGYKNILKEEFIIPEIEPEIPILDIKTAKTLNDGEEVVIQGTISVPPGILSNQYLYLQDQSGGIQIYYYQADFPAISRGDIIRVYGELSTYSSERRLKIASSSDITILSNGALVNPTERIIGDIVDNDVGSLVSSKGIVTETSGDTFIISDGQSIMVIIRPQTLISKPKMKRGDRVNIMGVVSSYRNQLRILPISQDGVTILTSGKLPVTGADLRENVIWNLSAKTQQKQVMSYCSLQLVCMVVICYVSGVIWAVVKLPRSNISLNISV